MALTVTNSNTISLLNILNKNSAAQATTLQQLATGKMINQAKDNPSGLVAFTLLDAELTAVNASLSNNLRTDSMLSVIDASMVEISSLLNEIESLVASSASDATLSATEVAANQSQIDDALTAIDRIVNTANFNGRTLLDGTFGIQTAGLATNADIDNLRVFARGQTTSDSVLTIDRVASAQVANATLGVIGATDRTNGSTEIAITGSLGTAMITLASGLTQAQIVTEINAAKGQTGVSAIQTATDIDLNSTTFGTDAFVSTEVITGGVINDSYGTAVDDGDTSNDFTNAAKTTGADVDVTINGQSTGSDGLDVSYSANGLSFDVTLSSDFGTGNTASTSTVFTVKAAGGATFQLGTTTTTRQTIGIDSMASYKLGGTNGTVRMSELKSGGSADLITDTGKALDAVREALTQLASSRGRIGGFQKFQVGSAINMLQAQQIGITEAASVIMDTDFAVATAKLNQEQILISAGISLLGLANQQSAQILALL